MKHNYICSGSMLLGALVLACQPTAPAVDAPEAVASHAARGSGSGGATRGRTYPRQMRPCRSDQIFIDVPLRGAPPWTNLNFLAGLKASLATAAQAGGWFCDANGCPTEAVDVVAEVVFPQVSGYAPRQDGHLRHLRLRFEGVASQTSYHLNDEGACRAVEATRAALVGQSYAPDEFFVGRECDVTVMSLQSAPTLDMLAWHTRRLGLPDSALNALPPAGASGTELVLIDTGIDPGVASAIGALPGPSTTPLAANDHGTAMGILARQVAPNAALYDFRAVDPGGSGTSAAIAQAVDAALFPLSADDGPIVINMSVGAPPELARASVLSVGSCFTHEDPFGESIRYALDTARRIDTDGIRPVFVVAAAGNRPLPVDPALFPPLPSDPLSGNCNTQTFSSDEWFIPGQWHRTDSCRTTLGTERLVFASSAITDTNKPSIVGIAGSESPLVAPGQHVIVANAAAASVPGVCTSTPPMGVTLPVTYTGSSVASALTAGAAARAQDGLLASGHAPLNRDALARLLYLTGLDTCRISVSGARVRRLHVGRLDQAIAQCPYLVQCAAAVTGLEPIAPGLLNSCKGQLEHCGLERLDAAGNLIYDCPATPGAPTPVPPGDPSSACVLTTGTPAPYSASACAPSCPDEAVVDSFSVGTLGPQPPDHGCPHCQIEFVNNTVLWLTLYADLNPDFPSATTFSNPVLRLSDGTSKVYVNLDDVSAGPWAPGANQKITMQLSGVTLDTTQMKADLLLDILTPDAKYATTDISPLIVQEQ